MRPLPEKWHGLTDVEQRYRQRYLDLVATPGVRETFVKRARIVSTIRRFLDGRGYLEVETPTLHKPEEAGGAAARPFETHHNALDLDLKLRIATELHLKRLVVGGFDRVYEIGRIFRNEGIDRRHNPEFTSIEFYEAYATAEDLMRLTEELFHALAVEVTGAPVVTFQGQQIDFTPPYPRVSLVEVGARALGLSVEDALAGRGLAEALARAAARENESEDAWKLEQAAKRSPGEAIAAAFEVFGEPQLPKDRPAFVVDFPLETSPLSRRRDADPRLVDRFELFAGGMECANAFSELNDPADQRGALRGAGERARRRRRGGDALRRGLRAALEHGMPPTAGEGIGIDRVTMLFTDSASIRDVILFPLLKNPTDVTEDRMHERAPAAGGAPAPCARRRRRAARGASRPRGRGPPRPAGLLRPRVRAHARGPVRRGRPRAARRRVLRRPPLAPWAARDRARRSPPRSPARRSAAPPRGPGAGSRSTSSAAFLLWAAGVAALVAFRAGAARALPSRSRRSRRRGRLVLVLGLLGAGLLSATAVFIGSTLSYLAVGTGRLDPRSRTSSSWRAATCGSARARSPPFRARRHRARAGHRRSGSCGRC